MIRRAKRNPKRTYSGPFGSFTLNITILDGIWGAAYEGGGTWNVVHAPSGARLGFADGKRSAVAAFVAWLAENYPTVPESGAVFQEMQQAGKILGVTLWGEPRYYQNPRRNRRCR